MLTKSHLSVSRRRRTNWLIVAALLLFLGVGTVVIIQKRAEPAVEGIRLPGDDPADGAQAPPEGEAPFGGGGGPEVEMIVANTKTTPTASPPTPMTPSPPVTEPPSPEPAPAEVAFTLRTEFQAGKMLYVGVGGQIDGVVNPTLLVAPGTVVRAILINGDGMAHDLFFPDFEAKTDKIGRLGESAEATFAVAADQAGTYAYYCTLPGHRQAGQEGQLIVKP